MSLFPFSLNGSAEKSKSTTTSSGGYATTTTPLAPDWALAPTRQTAGRIGDLLNLDPAGLVAPADPLQGQAAEGARGLRDYGFNYDAAADLTRGAANTSWLDRYMSADTPFVSGGKASDYLDRYLNPYLSQVADAGAADFDAHAGRVRAQQALDLAGSGAFGGSGAALTQSLTEGELSRARASTLSSLRADGYKTALNAAAGDAERATQARLSNAQLAQQAHAQKVAFGFQAQQQQLQAANQLTALSNAYDDNLRSNVATQASVGAALRGIEGETRAAPMASTAQIVAMLNGLPIELFTGKTEAGQKQDTSTTVGSKVSLQAGLPRS